MAILAKNGKPIINEPAVVTLDLGLPPDPTNASEGLACLAEILQHKPDCKVIVITGSTDTEHALKAIGLGAYDYYQKPIDVDVLNVIVERAFKLAELEAENRALKQATVKQQDIIGNSDAILKACRMVEKIAPTEITTLLLGESGTGKKFLPALFTSKVQEQPSHLWLLTALQFLIICLRANSLVMKKAHLLALIKPHLAKSKLPMAGP